LCTILPLRNGPGRGDISTRYLAKIVEKSSPYRFDWAAVGSDLLIASTLQILIRVGMPHTSLLSAIDENRASNASLTYGEICHTTDTNKDRARTWKAWITFDTSPSHCLIFVNRSLRRRSPLMMPFFLEHFFSTRSIPSSSLFHRQTVGVRERNNLRRETNL